MAKKWLSEIVSALDTNRISVCTEGDVIMHVVSLAGMCAPSGNGGSKQPDFPDFYHLGFLVNSSAKDMVYLGHIGGFIAGRCQVLYEAADRMGVLRKLVDEANSVYPNAK